MAGNAMETDEKTERIDLTDATQGGLFGTNFAPSGKRKAPSASRAAVAERVRKHMAAEADIGEIPAVADPERRARCEASLVAFAREYCMGILLARAPSPRLEAYAKRLQDSIEGVGFTHVRFPRGAGKTTWIKAAVAWGMATGRLRFPVIYCASAALATGVLADVWSVFSASEPFAEDFPEVSFPIRAGGGSAQRWLSQTYRGVPTNVRKSLTEIRLPTIEGAAGSGAVARAFGTTGASRGLSTGTLRPDFVLLDDLQTRKVAASPSRVRALAKWIQQDVLGLGGGNRAVSVAMTSTPILPGDLSEEFADEAQHPEWKTVEWPLVVSWPKRADLWDEYLDIRRECVRAGDTTFAEATAFYDAHREEMDEGGDVLDPGAFDPRVERSAIQRAFNLVASQGREAFDAEYQLAVHRGQTAVTVTPALVASRVNGVERLTLPRGMFHAFAFLDVNAVAGITWTVTGFGPRQTAAVLDYGRYPGGGTRLVPKNATEREERNLVHSGLAKVLRRIVSLRLVVRGGTPRNIEMVGIDMGYLPKTVLNVTDEFRNMVRIAGFRGRSNPDFLRLKDTAGRNVDGVKEHADADGSWFFQNSDMWKEIVQRGFLGEPLEDGSVSLFGDSPREHEEFASEITAESLDEKLESRRGDLYRWTLKPGADNHFLDSTSGTFALASLARIYAVGDDGAPRPAFRRVEPLPEEGRGASDADMRPDGTAAPVGHVAPAAARPGPRAFSWIVA